MFERIKLAGSSIIPNSYKNYPEISRQTAINLPHIILEMKHLSAASLHVGAEYATDANIHEILSTNRDNA